VVWLASIRRVTLSAFGSVGSHWTIGSSSFTVPSSTYLSSRMLR
jgi:hypothetical protein